MITFFKQLFFPDFINERRKKLHYFLLGLILLLQVLVLLIAYNETINVSKLQAFESDLKLAKKSTDLALSSKADLLETQANFFNYLSLKDSAYLSKYLFSLDKLTRSIDDLNAYYATTAVFKSVNTNEANTKKAIVSLRALIDSTSASMGGGMANPFDFISIANFKATDILNSVDVESTVETDSVSKKGFFGRLKAAVSGSVDVQKEKTNVTVTMKYGQKIETGTIQEQLQLAFDMVNSYYQLQLQGIRTKAATINQTDSEWVVNNDAISKRTSDLLAQFSSLSELGIDTTQKQFDKQLATNAFIKKFTMLALIFVMILITIILGYFTRITFAYEKRLEIAQNKILQNLNFKNRIVGMISHEVRSPLSIISIYSNYLSKKIEDVEIKEVFKSLQFTTNSLMVLTNQILDFSKNENTKLQLVSKPFVLNHELEQIMSSLGVLAESKENKLNASLQLSKQYTVNSDLAKIHQLLYNIVGNANKFTDKGLITIAVHEKVLHTKQLTLWFEIEDTGKGIAENDLKQVFEAYHQGEDSNPIANLGVGLGLNICKELVSLFKGKIEIESELNKGTKVKFHINLEVA